MDFTWTFFAKINIHGHVNLGGGGFSSNRPSYLCTSVTKAHAHAHPPTTVFGFGFAPWQHPPKLNTTPCKPYKSNTQCYCQIPDLPYTHLLVSVENLGYEGLTTAIFTSFSLLLVWYVWNKSGLKCLLTNPLSSSSYSVCNYTYDCAPQVEDAIRWQCASSQSWRCGCP